MIWLALLKRFWLPLLAVALLIGAAWYTHHAGYESGYAASEAQWQERFAAAERARAEANEKARRKEEDSKALSEQSEKHHAETVASLALRAADAEQRIRALSVRLASASSNRCEVPAISGAASIVDASSASAERAERIGASLSDIGRRCELDSATLVHLQRWLIEQRAIMIR